MEQESFNQSNPYHFYNHYQSPIYENNSNLPPTPPPNNLYPDPNYYQDILPFSQFQRNLYYDSSFQTIFGIGNSIYNKTSTMRTEDFNFYLNSPDFCGYSSSNYQMENSRSSLDEQLKIGDEQNGVNDCKNRFDEIEANWSQIKNYEMATGNENSLDGKIVAEDYTGISHDSDDTGTEFYT